MSDFNEQTQIEQPQAPPTGQIPPPAYPYPPQPGVKVLHKSPLLATLLSSFPGLGQVYVGYYQTGFMFAAYMACSIAILNLGLRGPLTALVAISLAFFWIFNMIDANRRAFHYNRAMDGLGGEEVPEDFKLPGSGGSVLAGGILIVLGVLITLDLNSTLSMEWLEDWWPMLLVAGGVWLVVKGRRQAS